MAEYIEKQWREITSRNPVKGAEFPQGLKDFKFSVGQGYGFIPAQSYFKIDLKLGKYNATGDVVKPVATDNVTFADGVCGNLFNNIYFNMGGQTISSITSGLPQVDILMNRLTKSKAWNDTVGLTQGFHPFFSDRKADLLTDVTGEETNNPLKNVSQRNERTFMWQPAIGIFDYSIPLGAGEYDIQLNPSQDYQKAGIDSSNTDEAGKTIGTADGEFTLIVQDIKFYACIVRVNFPSSGIETLHLMEKSVHTHNVPANTGNNIDAEISVPTSTRAISLFLQDQQAGKTTSVPPSKFHIAGPSLGAGAVGKGNKIANTIKDYQIEYAGVIKPTVRYKSDYSDDKLQIQQRYINCALETGQYFNPAGFESFLEYLERGPFLHESFIKSADNLATRCHVVASYADSVREGRLFIVAHYSRTIEVTRQNGLIVDVRAVNK